MRISDWSSDVCSSDLLPRHQGGDLLLLLGVATLALVVVDIAGDRRQAGAAVVAGHQAASLEVVEIAADRLLGYREGLGEAADGDEAAALQQAEDALMPRRDAVPGVAGAGAAAARISCQRHDWPPAFFLPVQEWPVPFSFGSLTAMPDSASRRSI